MDTASMIMGAAIASIGWLCFVPQIRRSGARRAAEGKGDSER